MISELTEQEAREALFRELSADQAKELRGQIFLKRLPDGRIRIDHRDWDVIVAKDDDGAFVCDRSWER